MKCATASNSSSSPQGTPVTLTIEPDADTDEITALLDRADALGRHYAAHGWALAEAQPSTPGPAELEAGSTFAGYSCSPTVETNGLPTWIIVDGKQAQRREKQGDVWYSVKLVDGSYEQVLRVPKGEQAPPVRGLWALAVELGRRGGCTAPPRRPDYLETFWLYPD